MLGVEKHTPTIELVSHLVPTNKSKRSWVFPEEARVLAVDTDSVEKRQGVLPSIP